MFTEAELEYLRSQRLGRLATEAPDGTLQNSPVGFGVDAEAGVILIRGRDLGNTRKFRNIAANGKAAFVVDDIASVNPWIVRCFEVRGTAEALTGQQPPNSYMSPEVIRLHPAGSSAGGWARTAKRARAARWARTCPSRSCGLCATGGSLAGRSFPLPAGTPRSSPRHNGWSRGRRGSPARRGVPGPGPGPRTGRPRG